MEQFVALLNGIVYAKLSAISVIVQFVKMGLGFVPALKDKAGAIVGAVASAAAIWFAVTGGIEAGLDAMSIVAQAALSVAYTHFFYLGIVRPLARSSNPIMPANPALLAATIVVALLVLAPAVGAQTAPYRGSVFDVKKRTQVAVDVGAIQFAEQETGLEVWRGASAGGLLVYSLHERLALMGRYDHGFPVDADRTHQDVWQAFANLKMYPLPGDKSATALALGAGGLWINPGGDASDDWSGLAARLNVSRIFRDGWSLFGTYTHGFEAQEQRPKLNLLKIGLQHRLLGAK